MLNGDFLPATRLLSVLRGTGGDTLFVELNSSSADVFAGPFSPSIITHPGDSNTFSDSPTRNIVPLHIPENGWSATAKVHLTCDGGGGEVFLPIEAADFFGVEL